jgi:glycosyltransferase involved in cell wall biosynthesis
MKVIFLTRESYNLAGARIRCYNFARAISKYGIDTEVFSFSEKLGAYDGEREALMGLRDKVILNYRAFKRLAQDRESFFYVQRFNYHSFAPYLAHLFNRNRIILDLDDWEMREDIRYSKAHFIIRRLARKSHLCISASRFLEQFLKTLNQNTYYIPSGVDTELFKPSQTNPNGKKVVFCWIGTFHKLEYIENLHFALDCFKALRSKYSDIFFDIVGDGIYRNMLLGLIKKNDDSNIRLKGWFAPDAIPAYLNNIDIGLFPVAVSNKFNLSKSPTKLFEYMAMAKPVVASAIGEPVHILSDGEDGFLAATKEEFIDKIRILLENPSLRQDMGQRARKTAQEQYSLNVLGERLCGILNKIQ